MILQFSRHISKLTLKWESLEDSGFLEIQYLFESHEDFWACKVWKTLEEFLFEFLAVFSCSRISGLACVAETSLMLCFSFPVCVTALSLVIPAQRDLVWWWAATFTPRPHKSQRNYGFTPRWLVSWLSFFLLYLFCFSSPLPDSPLSFKLPLFSFSCFSLHYSHYSQPLPCSSFPWCFCLSVGCICVDKLM